MKLPPKNAYRLEEIAKAWSCATEDLLEYWMDGKLRIALLLPYIWVEVINICDEGRHVEQDTTSGLHYLEMMPYEKQTYIIGFVSDLIRDQQFTLDFNHQLYPCELVDGHGNDIFDNWDNCDDGIIDIAQNEYHNQEGEVLITIRDLRITDIERQRFEKEELDQTTPETKPLNPREENNLFKTIAILTHLLTELKGPKFRISGDRVNINQITEEITKYIDANNIDKSGMANRTIHKRLSKALDSLKKQ